MKRSAKCRSCRNPVDRKQAVRIGGSRYHTDCADARPKARQEWRDGRWVRVVKESA